MKIPIIDFHCDLLFYLELQKHRTPFDRASRCSIPQLHAGNVRLQTLAIFTETGPQCVESGSQQLALFKDLPVSYPKDFAPFSHWEPESPHIHTLFAYENASGFCSEQEPLQNGLERLEKNGKPLYVSLTWNSENRFGGGAATSIGLKEDGRCLLEELSRQGIAIDLSHTSDPLAYEILDYLEGKGLNPPIMASHSNARAVKGAPRNLSDEIAKEIFRRQGIVGLNLYRSFVGEAEEDLLKHLLHWLELGGQEAIVFGADFFCEMDLPSIQNKKDRYFLDYQDASCYGRLMDFIQRELRLDEKMCQRLAYQNALSFIQRKK